MSCSGLYSRAVGCVIFGLRLGRMVAEVSVTSTNYHGWPDSYVLQNKTAAVTVVPAVGRVMQFRLAGETDGPFWENPALMGKPMPKNPWETPGSFGGDKTWPAPQSAWNWPPPDVFDAMPLSASLEGNTVVVRSPVSARFGIRTLRTISLNSSAPKLQIVTRYDKVAGEPVEVGVWVITQTRVPEASFLAAPQASIFPTGLASLWKEPAPWVHRHPGLIEFGRDPKNSQKIGNDGGSLVWVGRKWTLRIDVGRVPGASYADGGCSTELYSNPDPSGYVEMETLGPLRRLAVGDSLSATNVYTLSPRREADVVAEARRVLKP